MADGDSCQLDQRQAYKCLETFGLTDYFPGKITIQDARRYAKTKVSKDEDIPWYFIGQTLSGFDQEGWYALELSNDNIVKEVPEKKQAKKKATGFAGLLDDDDDEAEPTPTKAKGFAGLISDDYDEDSQSSGVQQNNSGVATKAFDLDDVKVSVFLCCDNILKKILSQKLFFSKLSVPFVLPDLSGRDNMIVQWWAFRGMRADVNFAHTSGALVSSIRCVLLLDSVTTVSYKPFLNLHYFIPFRNLHNFDPINQKFKS